MTLGSVVASASRLETLGEGLPALCVVEEFLLVRPDGNAACVAPGVLGAVAPELRVLPESTPFQVRSTTRICTDLSAVASGLSIARRALAESSADHGARLVSLGTLPFDAPEPVPGGREATCACRISVPVPSRDLGAAVLDRCRGWLPTLLALTGNSALWRGRDTGWSSHRFVVQGERQTSGLQPQHPTVEFRIADACPTVADAVLLAGLCRGLTAVALAREIAGRPRPDVPDRLLAASARAAARWGLGAYVVHPLRAGTAPASVVLDALLGTVLPALDAAGDLPLVTALLQERLRRGSGADRQRSLRRRCDRQALVQTLANACAGVELHG